MKTAAEWYEFFGGWGDPFEEKQKIIAVQQDALESAKVHIVDALQGDYYMEQAEGVVSETIERLKEGPIDRCSVLHDWNYDGDRRVCGRCDKRQHRTTGGWEP